MICLYAAIGERIKQIMRERRISAKELSQATGIPASTIAQWVNYKQTPRPDALLVTAHALSVPIEFLITGEHPEEKVIKELTSSLEKTWVSLHEGTYRIKIERQFETRNGPKAKG